MTSLCKPLTAQASRTWCYFNRTLIRILQKMSSKASGGPQTTKMLPRQGKASRINDGGVPRLPQEGWKLSPIWPKRGQREANWRLHNNFKSQIHWKSWKNLPELMPRRWKPEICEIDKIIEKTKVFQWFSMIFNVLELGKSRKNTFF